MVELDLAARSRQADDLKLFLLARIPDIDIEHEPVELGFGQRIGAFLLDGVLRGQHEERLRQPMQLAAGGNLMLLHGFQQSGLRFRRRSVDFVGEDDVGEDRPANEAHHSAAGGLIFLDDLGAGDVRRHQVRRELDAAEAQAQCSRQRRDQQRLGQPRHANQQRMAPAEHGHQQLFDDGLLPDDDLRQFCPHIGIRGLQLLNGRQLVGSQIHRRLRRNCDARVRIHEAGSK